MSRSAGRAYVFVRWSGPQWNPSLLGEVGWAFEYNDRLGRFFCFYCGATESRLGGASGRLSRFWHEKCLTLPELIKAMSGRASEAPAFDEVKVFEVEHAEPELALQTVAQRSALPDEMAIRRDALEDVREILTRYGVRGMGDSKGYSAPFLWYNMLPGRSVPLRRLPVHLFQLRVSGESKPRPSPAEIEDNARRIAESDADVRSVGECLVMRNGSSYILGLAVAIDPNLSVRSAQSIAERLEHTIRDQGDQIREVFVRIQAYDPPEQYS